MKLSLKALREWVDFQGSAIEIADVFSSLGFPNDGIYTKGGGLEQVVVGKIISKEKHPQADRLSLLKVNIGSEVLPVVCGAQNMQALDYVALAPVGAKIPGKDGQGMVMKEAKIRGEISRGMCCSAAELALAEESEGILLLPKDRVNDSVLGSRLSEIFDWQDSILEIDVTPNRPDALSIRGLAREFAAKQGLKLKAAPLLKWKNPVSQVNPSIESFEDAQGFAGCLVQGVRMGPTPEKWVSFLETCGARSLSNLVDISNIVLFEWGHPIHFFDADKMDPSSVGVRRAKSGETLELLNGKRIELHPEDLVIADKSGPLSLAGVMGGASSTVTEATKNIFIEVACFKPSLIRASARRHGLHSESSLRFERGLTAHRLDEVMERALYLLKELSGFETSGGTKTIDRNLALKGVLWDRARIEAKLGKISKTDDEIFEILRRLDYQFEPKGSTIRVVFPWYRVDVECLEDVMEDIARLLGYEALERQPLRSQESKVLWKNMAETYQLADRVIDRFLSLGFTEVIQMSFTSQALDTRLGYGASGFVELQNPIHAERAVLRKRLLPELLERAKFNAFHGEDEIRLVELGPVFSTEGSTQYEESPLKERLAVACVWLPRNIDKKRLWMRSADPYFEFRGMMESIWSAFKMRGTRELEILKFYPKRDLNFGHGMAGEVHPSLLKVLDISGRAFVGEWILEGEDRRRTYAVPPTYPSIDLDASFSCLKTLTLQEVMAVLKKCPVKYLEWIRPYDVFEPEDLKPSKKSMTFAMRYRDPQKTLTLEEAKKSHEELVSHLIKKLSNFEVALR